MNNKTDWDKYYNKPYKTASFTRKITGGALIDVIQKFSNSESLSVTELGGGNSCFFDTFIKKLTIIKYNIIDNNQLSIDLANKRSGVIDANLGDVLNISGDNIEKTDLVYSVGLIEHFSPENTKKAIETHFEIVKDGGFVIMTFPTPTILYRLVRYFAELFGVWIFYDERPLKIDEVTRACATNGELLYKKIIWSIFLTQYIVVWRKTF